MSVYIAAFNDSLSGECGLAGFLSVSVLPAFVMEENLWR